MTNIFVNTITVVLLASLTSSSPQKKWVWGEGQRSAQDSPQGDFSIAKPVILPGNVDTSRRLPLFQAAGNPRTDAKLFRDGSLREGNRPRYQVFEGGNEDPTTAGGSYPPLPPIRPGPGPGPFPDQPPHRPLKPLPPLPPPPPPGNFPIPGPGPINPPINSRPPNDPDAGILTGPVPSWEQPHFPKNGDPTSFDSCKCLHSFNCKSPGLQFGNCDVGKQYCCYNNPGYGLQSELGPVGGFGNKFGALNGGGGGPAVLAGPGGPVDIRPDFPGLGGGHPPLHPGIPGPFYDPRSQGNGFGRNNQRKN